MACSSAGSKPADELAELINAYRNAAPFCEGKRVTALGPLAPDPQLAAVRVTQGGDLHALLKRAGYQASRAQAIVVTGPRSASAAMGLLQEKYCAALTSPEFSQVGITREGNAWRLVLAQPLLDPRLGDWREAGEEVLRLTNAARASARQCGRQSFPAAPPLAWDGRLAQAALAHSRDMARRDDFGHVGQGGSKVDSRATRAGYDWQRIGENIATGQGSAQRVVAGWLASPSHCANLMSRDFIEMGAAYAVDPSSNTGVFWTQVLGRPR